VVRAARATAPATSLAAQGHVWYFYLFDARLPPPNAVPAREQEPQIDWVMVRQDRFSRCCSAPAKVRD
jgi:hypothetical protein